MSKSQMKFSAHGKDDEGNDVFVNIVDLNDFINAPPDAIIYVQAGYKKGGDVCTVCMHCYKGDIKWTNVILEG